MNSEAEATAIPEDERAEILGVAKGGGINLAGAAFTQAARFAIILMLVRLIGAAQAGLFFQAFAVLMILGLISTGSFLNSVTRFVAVHLADGDPGALRGTVRLSIWCSTGIGVLLAVGLYLSAPWVAREVFGDAEMVSLLRWMALCLPATAYTDIALSATQGFKTMRPYAAINLLFEPAARLVMTAALIAAGWDVTGAAVALLVANVGAAILSTVALRRLMGPPTAVPRYIAKELFSFSAVSWLSNLASNWLMWADTILLGIYLGPSQVSAYQVSSRLALLGAMVIGPLGTSFAPVAADLYRRGLPDALRRTYVVVSSWTVRLYLPAFVLLIVFPRELLSVFGPGFSLAASVVVILAVAQLINTATGPNGYLITMSGRVGIQLALNSASLVSNVALNMWLIPRYGIEGAAVAWGTCIAVFSLIRVLYVRRAMAMSPLDRQSLKTLLAGFAALAAALTVGELVDGLLSVLIAVPAVTGAYVGTLALAGFGDEDRLVFASLRRRIGLRSA